MRRRGFLTGLAGILAAGVAPAIITTPGLLMPVRRIVRPTLREGLRYGVIRDDIADIIYNIAPQETPFFDIVIQQTEWRWHQEVLRA